MSYGTLISTITVGSGGALSMTFSSIPSTYTDLLVVVNSKNNNTGSNYQNLFIGFNGVGTGYSGRDLAGLGTGAGQSGVITDSYVGAHVPSSNSNTTTFGATHIYIPNYTSSVNKVHFADGGSELTAVAMFMSLSIKTFTSSSAITSIALTTNSGINFSQYSSASLYGIK